MTIEFLPTDSVYQEPSNGSNDGYARLYWMNGEPRLQTPGRFWTFPERMDEASIQLESPWKSIEHTFSDGAQKTLLASPALHLAPICWRQQNFLKDASGNVDSWLPAGKRGKFAPGEGVYFEMLTFVEGSTEAMVFSAKGTKTAMSRPPPGCMTISPLATHGKPCTLGMSLLHAASCSTKKLPFGQARPLVTVIRSCSRRPRLDEIRRAH